MTKEIRAEIDNKGHYALQWIAGGGIVLLFHFYTGIYKENFILANFVILTAALNLWCLIRSLFLHKKRRDTSLKFDTPSSDKFEMSEATWNYWMNTIRILAASYILLIIGMGLSFYQNPLNQVLSNFYENKIERKA